jgi:hypothetical protein
VDVGKDVVVTADQDALEDVEQSPEPDADKMICAWEQVTRALQPLTRKERLRVLRAVSALWGYDG